MRLSKFFISLFLVAAINLILPSVARLPPPDVSNISQTIQSPVCAVNKSAFLVLFLVLSHPGNFQRRMLARSTYPATEINTLGVRRVFILGSLQNEYEPDPSHASISDAEIEAESERFSDIIRLNFTENYHRLPYKCLAAFTWAAEHCKQARFIAKTDDDVFIEYYTFRQKFHSIPRDEHDDDIKGYLYPGKNYRPTRDFLDRSYVSYEEYPYDRYPDGLAGALYVMSPKTLGLLVQTARSVPFLPGEDMYFTALVAERAGVRKSVFDNILALDAESPNCCMDREMARGEMYECQFLAFEMLVTLTASQARRIKEHGRFCFIFACRPHSAVALSAAPHFECF